MQAAAPNLHFSGRLSVDTEPLLNPAMRYDSLEELVDLPEEQALLRHFDAANGRSLRHYALATAILAFLSLLYELVQADYLRMVAPIATLVVVRWLFAVSTKPFFVRHFTTVHTILFLLLTALLPLITPNSQIGLRIVGFVAPLLLAFFRLSTARFWALGALVCGGTLAWPLIVAARAGEPIVTLRPVMQVIVTIIFIYLGISSTDRDRSLFLRRFRIESSRNRERLRMREELDSARQIQLRMLPSRDPRLEGAEIASVSLPANEVGGDYYDFYTKGDRRLGLVVADVAGHGVSSGLMLAAVRGCVYLLQDDEARPLEIIGKLDRMVRATADRRMFVTLLYALFDLEKETVTVASAGHPPLLHRATEGGVTEISLPAPPLGTRLAFDYRETTTSFGAGDLFVAYTDGLTETTNGNGDPYGDDRLQARLGRARRSQTAREIRESILSDLWNYKGDSEQQDDITLVVLRTADS